MYIKEEKILKYIFLYSFLSSDLTIYKSFRKMLPEILSFPNLTYILQKR